jgi:hypothetical protein
MLWEGLGIRPRVALGKEYQTDGQKREISHASKSLTLITQADGS